jgi:hypothetical protein
VYWRPEADPRTVILTDAPALGAPTLRFEPASWRGAYHEAQSDDGVHGLLRLSGADHRLWMPHAITPGAAVACVLPLGPGASWNASAVVRFWRHVSHGRAPEVRFDARLRRAQLSLLALDRREAGASYRSVAELVYGAGRVAAESWRTSSLRDATIRLVRSGAAFVAGDYRRLLRTPTEE